AQLRHSRACACLRPCCGIQSRSYRRASQPQRAFRRGDRCRVSGPRRQRAGAGAVVNAGVRLQWALLGRRNEGLRGLFALLLAMVLVYVAFFPGIVSSLGIAKLTQSWFPLAVVAMAQTLVMLTRGVDLTVGAMVSLGSVLSATLVVDSAAGSAFGILAVVGAGAF